MSRWITHDYPASRIFNNSSNDWRVPIHTVFSKRGYGWSRYSTAIPTQPAPKWIFFVHTRGLGQPIIGPITRGAEPLPWGDRSRVSRCWWGHDITRVPYRWHVQPPAYNDRNHVIVLGDVAVFPQWINSTNPPFEDLPLQLSSLFALNGVLHQPHALPLLLWLVHIR